MIKMREETNAVYEKYGTSPTGGCVSSLIQLPILFALWPVIQNIPAYVSKVKEAYMPLVEKIMAANQSNGMKITAIVDKYLGKGKKVGDATPAQCEQIDLILIELREMV